MSETTQVLNASKVSRIRAGIKPENGHTAAGGEQYFLEYVPQYRSDDVLVYINNVNQATRAVMVHPDGSTESLAGGQPAVALLDQLLE